MRKTAYFSLALMLAAVMLAARFGARPEPQRLAGVSVSAVASASVEAAALAPATAVHTATPADTPPTTQAPPVTPASSRTPMPAATEAGARPSAPDVLSRSGADAPATATEALEWHNADSRAVALPAPTIAPAPTDPPVAATPSPAPSRPADPRPPQAPERIVAPTVRLDSRIVPVGWYEVTNPDGSKSSEWDVPSYAVGWSKTSARLGEVGNTVLTGHNNIEGEVFRHLEHFNIGDPITIYAGGQAFQYSVTDKFILLEKGVPYEQRVDNAKWIRAFPDERVTLVSCWPYNNNTHRIFIIAKPAGKG